MKIILLAVAVAVLSLSALAFAEDTWVSPYSRSDGTYVPGHHRSTPDGNPWNNYSTQGNTNPYTGEKGHVDPNQYKPILPPADGGHGKSKPHSFLE